MENNEQINRVLINYFSHEASADEEAVVYEWLHASDENKLYFEKMKYTWKLSIVKQAGDKVDIDQEWDQFSKTLSGRQAKVVHLKAAPAPENNDTEQVRRIIPYKKIFSGAIAVAVLLFLGFQWGWFAGQTKTTGPVTVNDQIQSTPVLHYETNTSGATRKLLLQDGSEITLANNSEISYEQPFTGAKRDVILKGKATFKVAKDKNRPFTVISDEIATTALGTQFTVDNTGTNKNIVVSLLEGSVVIRSARLSQDYLLKPGEKLTYNREEATAHVSTWKLNKNAGYHPHEEAVPGHDSPSLPGDTGGTTWYMFNNQPLSDVFEQLKAMYNVKIEYSRKEVANMYFIGRFEKTDSLGMILERIAQANSLQMTRAGGKYTIGK
jgi:transmembrane sensor